jgi:hypothetical protein
MKTENVLILVGAVFIGYWLLKKKQNIISLDPPMNLNKNNETKTIVLDLTQKKPNRASMSQSFYDEFKGSGYDTSKFSTVAPPSVRVKNNLF